MLLHGISCFLPAFCYDQPHVCLPRMFCQGTVCRVFRPFQLPGYDNLERQVRKPLYMVYACRAVRFQHPACLHSCKQCCIFHCTEYGHRHAVRRNLPFMPCRSNIEIRIPADFAQHALI